MPLYSLLLASSHSFVQRQEFRNRLGSPGFANRSRSSPFQGRHSASSLIAVSNSPNLCLRTRATSSRPTRTRTRNDAVSAQKHSEAPLVATLPSAIPALLPHIKFVIPPKEFLSMKHSLFAVLVLGLISVGCTSTNKASTPDTVAQPNSAATSASSASSPSTNSDQDFVTKAAQGNSAEVELGKIVAAKSKNPSVKQFAQMMVKDHTTALNELQELAQTKNLNFNDDLPDDAKALQSKLSSDTGKQLDKDYMDSMVEDHQKDVQEFTDKSQNAKDRDVKQWASKTLPTLQKHLEKAQQIDAKLNKGKAASSAASGDSQ